MPGTYRSIRGRATYRYDTSKISLKKGKDSRVDADHWENIFKFAQMGTFKVAESLNIINIENKKREKLKKSSSLYGVYVYFLPYGNKHDLLDVFLLDK